MTHRLATDPLSHTAERERNQDSPTHRPGDRRPLTEEHAILLHELRPRHRAVRAGLDAGRWPRDEVAALVSYLRYEVLDQAVTEERVLFRLARRDDVDGRLDGLTLDHERIRDMTARLAGFATVEEPPGGSEALVDLLDGLEELVELHMRTEESVLSALPGVESLRQPFRCHVWFSVTEGPDIDLDELPREFVRTATLERLSRMQPGESLQVRCSHDLQGVWSALSCGHPREFGWDYLEEGPTRWRASITRRAIE